MDPFLPRPGLTPGWRYPQILTTGIPLKELFIPFEQYAPFLPQSASALIQGDAYVGGWCSEATHPTKDYQITHSRTETPTTALLPWS